MGAPAVVFSLAASLVLAAGCSRRATREPVAGSGQEAPSARLAISSARESVVHVTVLRRHDEDGGSGLLIGEARLVVTAEHVVRGAQELFVEPPDGARRRAELIGADPASDVALLRTESRLPGRPMALTGSRRATLGEVVVVVAEPFGVGVFATSGFVASPGGIGRDVACFEDYLQITAPVVPGMSGAPVMSVDGELLGLATATARFSERSPGLGFATPVTAVRSAVDRLLQTGRVERGWIGVRVQPITIRLARQLELPSTDGALVADLLDGGPAARAGLRRGDVIVALGDRTVDSVGCFRSAMAASRPDERVPLEVIRRGSKRTLQVPVRGQTAVPWQGATRDVSLGLRADLVSAQDTPLPSGFVSALRIAEVEPESRSGFAGLAPGDLVLEAAGAAVKPTTLAELERRPRDALLLVLRNGRTHYRVLP